MKRIYQVKFDQTWSDGTGTASEMNVLANGDAQKAIDKAKAKALRETCWVDGKRLNVKAFCLTSVQILAETTD